MWSFWRPRDRFSLEELRYLNDQLHRNIPINEYNKVVIVETLRSISELLIWGDQHEPSFFKFFVENEMLALFLRILRNAAGYFNDVIVQLLQTLNIIILNIQNEFALKHMFSKDHINSIILFPFNFSDEELLAYYISLLRTISMKIIPSTISCFLYRSKEGSLKFPLYTEAIKFFHHEESMVRIAVRTLTLNVYNLNDDQVKHFISKSNAVSYFEDLANFVRQQAFTLDSLFLETSNSLALSSSSGRLESCIAEVGDLLFYCNDIMNSKFADLAKILSNHLLKIIILPVILPSLCDRQTEINSTGVFLSPLCAMYLLSRFLLIVSHGPLLEAVITRMMSSISSHETIVIESLIEEKYRSMSMRFLENGNKDEDNDAVAATDGVNVRMNDVNSFHPLTMSMDEPSKSFEKERLETGGMGYGSTGREKERKEETTEKEKVEIVEHGEEEIVLSQMGEDGKGKGKDTEGEGEGKYSNQCMDANAEKEWKRDEGKKKGEVGGEEDDYGLDKERIKHDKPNNMMRIEQKSKEDGDGNKKIEDKTDYNINNDNNTSSYDNVKDKVMSWMHEQVDSIDHGCELHDSDDSDDIHHGSRHHDPRHHNSDNSNSNSDSYLDSLIADFDPTANFWEAILSYLLNAKDRWIIASLSIIVSLLQNNFIHDSLLDSLGILPRKKHHRQLLMQSLVNQQSDMELSIFSVPPGKIKDDIQTDLKRDLSVGDDVDRCRNSMLSKIENGEWNTKNASKNRKQILNGLMNIVCRRPPPSAEALWHAGWLLHQLLPHQQMSHQRRKLSPARQKFLDKAYDAVRNDLRHHLFDCWCDQLPLAIDDEWKICKKSLEMPSLQNDSSFILLPNSELYNNDDDSCAAIGVQMRASCKAFVALHQMRMLFKEGSIPEAPPLAHIEPISEPAAKMPSEPSSEPVSGPISEPTSEPVSRPIRTGRRGVDLQSVHQGTVLELGAGDAMSCRVAFERGKEESVQFAVASGGVGGWLLLMQPLTRTNMFKVRMMGPLAGCQPQIDSNHPHWLQLRIRTSARPSAKAGTLGLVHSSKSRNLTDGIWILAFPDDQRCKFAYLAVMEEMHIQSNRVRTVMEPILGSGQTHD